VTESSEIEVKDRAVLVQQGDELSEFVELLNELEVPIDICRNAMPTEKQLASAAIAVLPGSRLIEAGAQNLSRWPRTIAVIDDSSKTLASHLNRLGVAMVIRRPIHPRTMRLLLLHEIYRGPERRNRKRTLIGHPVRIGSGLFKQRATLLDLSPSGARIELPNAPKIGSKLRILIGKDLTLGKPLKLDAKVVRCIRPSGGKGREEGEIGIALINPRRQSKAIRSILDRFLSGPASWNGKLDTPEPPPSVTVQPTVQSAEEPPPLSEEIDPSESARRLPPSFTSSSRPPEKTQAAEESIEVRPAASPGQDSEERSDPVIVTAGPVVEARENDHTRQSDSTAGTDSGETAAEEEAEEARPPERRSDPRIPYDRRVVALGEEAARVLVGRDLSQGGMRIASNEYVAIGDVLRVALHSGDDMEPLIVLADALRNDGDNGTVLSFQALSNAQRDGLEKIIASCTSIHANSNEGGEGAEAGGPIVFGEMLETVKRATQSIDSEEDIDAHLDSIFDTGESVEDVR